MTIKMIAGPRNEELIQKVREAAKTYKLSKYPDPFEQLSEEYGCSEVFDALYYACERGDDALENYRDFLLDIFYSDEDCIYLDEMTDLMDCDFSFRFNLGLEPEEADQIADDFCVDEDVISVYKKNGSVYAEFCAESEKEIDGMIDEACSIILFHYPDLSLAGGAFEE